MASSAFQTLIKDFLSTNVVRPLAEVSFKNQGKTVEELVELFIAELDLPVSVCSAPSEKKIKRKTPSPKTEQKWLTYEQYNDLYEESFICGYVQTRGKYKDHYCGVPLDDNNVVTWTKENGFTQTTPDKELENVEDKRSDMRCKLCWSRDPKTGEHKRKKGRGDKLNSEHRGDIVAPTVIPGVSVPDNAGLMGFLSGNNTTFQSPTRAMEANKVIRAKRFNGLVRNEDYSHVIPNPEHHENMPFLIRHDDSGQFVIGKFDKEIDSSTCFSDNYIEDIVPLTEDDLKTCSIYNIKYVPYEPSDDDDIDIPVVQDREEDTTTIQDDDDIDVPTLDIDDLLNE